MLYILLYYVGASSFVYIYWFWVGAVGKIIPLVGPTMKRGARGGSLLRYLEAAWQTAGILLFSWEDCWSAGVQFSGVGDKDGEKYRIDNHATFKLMDGLEWKDIS